MNLGDIIVTTLDEICETLCPRYVISGPWIIVVIVISMFGEVILLSLVLGLGLPCSISTSLLSPKKGLGVQLFWFCDG